jgi:pimeloyl-ACP methyl ester carboxylesterase
VSSERLIYLHGFASSPASQKAVYFRDRLAEAGFDLAIPDLAEGDFEHLTVTGQLAVIDRLAAGLPTVLIGSSMGGYLAALYAARRPNVRRILLLAPAFGFTKRWPDSFGPEQVETWKHTGFLEVYHYGDHRMRRLSYRLVEDGSTYEDFPSLRQPCRIFHGVHDTVVPVELSRTFAQQHPQVCLEVLDSDHQLLNVLPHIWQRSRQFLIDARV